MKVIKDDYIRKIEAVKILQKAYTEGRIKAKDGCISVLDDINALPKADVQPVKHGRWESSQRTIETGTVYCSNCAIEYYISDLQTVGDCNGIVHYCPNCGARMDGGNEDEND